MKRKQYLIPEQLKSFSMRDAQILRLLGIDFAEFSPAPDQQDILLQEVDFPIRALNILWNNVAYPREDWKTMTISQFVGEYSEKDLLRFRNCGKKTICEINNAIYPYGFKLTKGT